MVRKKNAEEQILARPRHVNVLVAQAEPVGMWSERKE